MVILKASLIEKPEIFVEVEVQLTITCVPTNVSSSLATPVTDDIYFLNDPLLKIAEPTFEVLPPVCVDFAVAL